MTQTPSDLVAGLESLERQLANQRISLEILTGANRGLAEKNEQLKQEVRDLRAVLARLLEEQAAWKQQSQNQS